MFDNFISLGSYCGAAASMSKLGIRSVSGPFDWIISSDLKSVVSCLENDFSDFFDKKNLVVPHERGGVDRFTDIKHSFYFLHDIKNSFEEDYDFIYEKYMRRINYFKEQIIQKTCFIRVIYNVDELKYIRANQQFINDVIKQFHKDNEIVYVVNRNIFGHEREASHPFYLVASYETGNRKELRELFDQNLKLCNFCIVNYDENHRYKNMTFDLQNEIRGLEYRNDLMDKIDRLNVEEMEIPAKIIIYGAGRIGKYFYNKVKAICQVLFFIDKSPREDAFDGVPVICYGDQLDILVDTLVVVSACYEYEEVRTNLLKRYGEINIISLEDLYEK